MPVTFTTTGFTKVCVAPAIYAMQYEFDINI
jgi:hypothetical protein